MIVFITGGTGYIGRGLIADLLRRGHQVRALARRGSESKLPSGCTVIAGDATEAATYSGQVPPADTFVQLTGVSHPSPAKAKQFREVDLASVRAACSAAVQAGIRHFIYVSVAHPAPVMKAYIQARAEGESILRASGLNVTILRPWYVLGPGRWWPAVLLPLYWLMERIPRTRDSAKRLGLVTRRQMTGALLRAVENPSHGITIVEVPEIRRSGLKA